MTYLSHRIRLYPNNVQVTYFKRACGIRRKAYNWALDESRKLYEAGIKTSDYDLSKRFNAIKKEQWPWMSEVIEGGPVRLSEVGGCQSFPRQQHKSYIPKAGI